MGDSTITNLPAQSSTPSETDVTVLDVGTPAVTKKITLSVLGGFFTRVSALAASNGSALIGHIATGVGAVPTTAQAELRAIFSRNGFGTLSQAIAAAGFVPVVDPTTGKVFFNSDSSALNYSNTRAGLVLQQRDTASGSASELVPGAVFQFTATGNGVVNSGTETSSTIWQGLYAYMSKTGDGSAHCVTGIGQLGAVGVGGYNELGGFQAELTNVGSVLGTISGVEMLIKDSPDAGSTTYSTKMQAIVGRIAKYNPTTRKSYNFYASSEGTRAPNAILGGNTAGLAQWQRGFDFEGLTFTTGQFGLAPNNTALAWLDASANARSILGVNASNETYTRPGSSASLWGVQNFAGSSYLMTIFDNGNVGINTGTTDQLLKFKVHGSTAGGEDLIGIENTNSTSVTTKYAGFRFRGRDTINTGKDSGYIRAAPVDVNYSAAYLSFTARAADAMTEGFRVYTTGPKTTVATALMGSTIALNNGAAAASGTLTNAPAAGNPTKWIPIDDNGTTRYIPAW